MLRIKYGALMTPSTSLIVCFWLCTSVFDPLFLLPHNRKAKTQRGKRFLESREPKVVENRKTIYYMQALKSNEQVRSLMKDMVTSVTPSNLLKMTV